MPLQKRLPPSSTSIPRRGAKCHQHTGSPVRESGWKQLTLGKLWNIPHLMFLTQEVGGKEEKEAEGFNCWCQPWYSWSSDAEKEESKGQENCARQDICWRQGVGAKVEVWALKGCSYPLLDFVPSDLLYLLSLVLIKKKISDQWSLWPFSLWPLGKPLNRVG